MAEILIPFRIEGLLLKPDMAARVRLSDDMQQTLASVVGYDGSARQLLRCSQSGVLSTTTPRIKGQTHIIATTDAYVHNFDSEEATEIMVMGHPDNIGRIWVRFDATANAWTSWPLDAKDVVIFSISNMSNVHLLIETDTDTTVVAWTR